jgi:hypothetical protein
VSWRIGKVTEKDCQIKTICVKMPLRMSAKLIRNTCQTLRVFDLKNKEIRLWQV